MRDWRSPCRRARRGTALMALLILPLAVPLLIFGTLASLWRSRHHQPASNAFGRRFCAAFGLGTAGRGERLEISETETGL